MSEWQTGWTEGYASARSEAQAEILRLRVDNEKLRAALKPFAEQADNTPWRISPGMMFAAAAALKETKDE